jgi:hypothetical protein
MTTATYPAVRNETAERLIGNHRWHGCVKALQHKFGDDVQIRVGETATPDSREDVDVWVNSRKWDGGLIGLEDWAKGQYWR